MWLAKQLRPFGIRPATIWIGQELAKGYRKDDFRDVFSRYISRADFDTLAAALGHGGEGGS